MARKKQGSFEMKGHTLPGINQKSETVNIKDGRSPSSAFQQNETNGSPMKDMKTGSYKHPFEDEGPLYAKTPTGKTDLQGRPISTQEDAPQEYPGYGNIETPDNLYKEDGTKVSTANIDEGELSGDKTDDKGRYTTYSDGTKYYYKKQ